MITAASTLRLRCWDTKAKRFLTEVPPEEYMLDSDTWRPLRAADMADSMFHPAYPVPTFGGRLEYDLWTGLKDRLGRDIYEGDLVVTENDHAKGGDRECDDWKAADWGVAVVSTDPRWGVRMQTQQEDVWSWDEEGSVYHLRFLRVVGNVRENDRDTVLDE